VAILPQTQAQTKSSTYSAVVGDWTLMTSMKTRLIARIWLCSLYVLSHAVISFYISCACSACSGYNRFDWCIKLSANAVPGVSMILKGESLSVILLQQFCPRDWTFLDCNSGG